MHFTKSLTTVTLTPALPLPPAQSQQHRDLSAGPHSTPRLILTIDLQKTAYRVAGDGGDGGRMRDKNQNTERFQVVEI